MPIIQGPGATMPTDEFTAWGHAEYKAGRKNVTESHYHDCDEFLFMLEGKMLMRSEGTDYIVVRGDVLVTRMGDEHAILEILEATRLFWLEGQLCGEKRHGHLHRNEEAKQ